MYSEPTVSTLQGFVNAIAVAAAAAGWAVERNNLSGAFRTITLKRAESDYIHVYNNFTGGLNYVEMNVSTGYSAGAAGDAQPGQPTFRRRSNFPNDGPFAACFVFSNTTPVPFMHVVLEYQAGFFRHFSFGLVVKYGAWLGGTYVTSTNAVLTPTSNADNVNDNNINWQLFSYGNGGTTAESVLRCDIAGVSYLLTAPTTNNILRLSGGSPGENPIGQHYANADNPFSGTTPMATIHLWVRRTDSPDFFATILGEPAKLRFINMARFAPKDEFTTGPDTWKVFPFLRKGVGSGQLFSQNYAYAYLKEV